MKRVLFTLAFFILALESSCTTGAMAASLDVNTYIPPKAIVHLPTLKSESQRLFPEFETYQYFGSLIEHESCLSLSHKRCWEPTSRLKTQREEGAGLGQITRTWKKDGSPRFDTLSDLAKAYRTELKELSWNNIYSRPDLQMRAIILLYKQNYKQLYMIEDDFERMAFADAAYNGGLGGVTKDRRLCSLKKGCDPKIWFGETEITCSKSKEAMYGQRSPCDINRHHVRDVLTTRLPKYIEKF